MSQGYLRPTTPLPTALVGAQRRFPAWDAGHTGASATGRGLDEALERIVSVHEELIELDRQALQGRPG